MRRYCLSIGGSDPSASAGIQADARVFQLLGTHPCTVPTMITIQNPSGVKDVSVLPGKLVHSQIAFLLEGILPNSAKCGALGSAENVMAVVQNFSQLSCPLVVDTIIKSSNGVTLTNSDGVSAMISELFPIAKLITPNVPEAEIILGQRITSVEQMKSAARELSKFGAQAVLLKGGHLEGECTDILFADGEIHSFSTQRMELSPEKLRGTGCLLSAAIAANLSRNSCLVSAVSEAKKFLTEMLRGAPA